MWHEGFGPGPDSYGNEYTAPPLECESSAESGATQLMRDSSNGPQLAPQAQPLRCGCCCAWCAAMCNGPVLVIHGGSLPSRSGVRQ